MHWVVDFVGAKPKLTRLISAHKAALVFFPLRILRASQKFTRTSLNAPVLDEKRFIQQLR